MEKLNTIELDVANEIMNIGLAKSADSLSFFIKEKILITGCEVEIKNISQDLTAVHVDNDAKFILTTEIIGDLNGAAYLILSQSEADKLVSLSIPADTIKDADKYEEMSRAMLMEVDNIITASVLTQFSNLLNIRMFGGVPMIAVKNKEEIEQQIMHDLKGKEYIVSLKADFECDDVNFKPEFIWLLGIRFLDGVKDFIKGDPGLMKLDDLKSNIDARS